MESVWKPRYHLLFLWIHYYFFEIHESFKTYRKQKQQQHLPKHLTCLKSKLSHFPLETRYNVLPFSPGNKVGCTWTTVVASCVHVQVSEVYYKSSGVMQQNNDSRNITLIPLLFRQHLDFCLTFWSPFFGAFPQELQEELLSCEAVLFHISPSSSSHWLVLRFTSSPPLPQPSCIDFEAAGKGKREKKNLTQVPAKLTAISFNAISSMLTFEYFQEIQRFIK